MNPNESENIGDKFQEETKYFPNRMPVGGLNWDAKPELYKTYPNAKKIHLHKPDLKKNINFNEILRKRKSIRFYSKDPLNLEELSYLLWTSTGIQRIEFHYEFRTAPSAGALYPIETYIVINDVVDLKPGIYHYMIKTHELELLKEGNFGIPLANAALKQKMCAEASVVFVFTAIFNRSKWKYKQRAYRYIYLDAGHIAENLGLAVTALNLGGCHVAAIFDDEVNKIIEVDGKSESVIYLMPIGHLK